MLSGKNTITFCTIQFIFGMKQGNVTNESVRTKFNISFSPKTVPGQLHVKPVLFQRFLALRLELKKDILEKC